MQFSKRFVSAGLALSVLVALAARAGDSPTSLTIGQSMAKLHKSCAIPKDFQETCLSGEAGKRYNELLKAQLEGADELIKNLDRSGLDGHAEVSKDISNEGCQASDDVARYNPNAVAVMAALGDLLKQYTETKPKFRYFIIELNDAKFVKTEPRFKKVKDMLVIRVGLGSCDLVGDDMLKFDINRQLYLSAQ